MRITVFFLIIFSAFFASAQCVDCTSFEEAMKDPAQVKSLKINAWQHDIVLDSLPSSIGLLVNAEVVYLSDHNFQSIPAEIGKLTKLRELSFAGCQLSTLPEELFALSNLREVILLNNNFSEEDKNMIKEKFAEKLSGSKVLIN